MANYNVKITNGSGSQTMKSGNYSVSVSAQGYEGSTLSPTTFTATNSGATGNFTVSATGTLNLTVNETGAAGGTPISSGSLIMTDSTGNTQYGTAVNVNASGEAVFNNVPFGTVDSPYTLYFKQLTTDDTHNIYEGVITVNMNAQTLTQYVVNTPIATQTFTLTDANYTGLPVANADLTFTQS